MKHRAFGLDIGATNVRAVWLSTEKNGYELLSASTASTPAKGMLSEAISDQEAMAQVLKKLVSDAKIGTTNANAALPESQVYTVVAQMPLLSDKELSSAIYWEAEQHIPVPLATITIDWKVLKRAQKQEEGKMDVLLVGAPTAVVEKYQRVFTMAGLTLVSVETEILATIRALVPAFREGSTYSFPNSIIVNIGATATPFAVVKDGSIVFTYSVPTGGAAINRAIATDFGFSLSQAEEYKRTYGIAKDALGGRIGQATTPILASIVSEIKKAIAFYNDKYKGEEPIAQILLSGGSAKLPGLELFFAQNCGIETVIANPWKVLINEAIPEEVKRSAPDFTIAMGLAMKEYE